MQTITMIEAERMIETQYDMREPFLLIGEPGMGKTSLFESVAKRRKIGFIANILSQKDPVDVGGIRVPDMKTGVMRHFVPEDVPIDAKIHGLYGMILYDEINVVSMLMQATAYGVIQEKRLGLHRLLEGWVPMGAGNNVTDGAAAQRISTALANRFNLQYVKPHLESWLKQYGSEHVDQRGTAFLRFRPEMFHKMPDRKASSDVRFPSARSWTKAFKFIEDEPVFRQKRFTGYVGEDGAREFEAFWRIMEKALTFEQIVDSPLQVPVPNPTELGLIYALVGMLSRLVDRKHFDAVVQYIGRMQKEYQVVFMQDTTKRTPSLKNTIAYGKWAVANQDVLL
jgi:hypothetical protein